MAARWDKPDNGTVLVLAQIPELAFIVGMHNGFLTSAIKNGAGRSSEDWQKAHSLVTKSPGYIFDSNSRNCWATILRVGETSDVDWHPAQEKVKAGASIREALWEPVAIRVNTKEVMVNKPDITYDDVVEFAGYDPSKGTIYSITCCCKKSRDFCMHPGKIVAVEEGMLFNCYYTGNA